MRPADPQRRSAKANRAAISAACEMTEIPGPVDRAFSQDVGLNLFRF